MASSAVNQNGTKASTLAAWSKLQASTAGNRHKRHRPTYTEFDEFTEFPLPEHCYDAAVSLSTPA